MKEIENYLECYTYDISIVIVNYNGRKYLDRLFESLNHIRHKDFSFEVIVVDNNSTDDSVEYMKNIRSQMEFDLRIIQSKTNRGFAGGNNLGVRKSQGEYLVLLNNDTVVDEYWLEELFVFMRSNKNIAMVNSKLLFFYDFIRINLPAVRDGQSIEINKEVCLCGENYFIETKYCKNVQEKDDKLICGTDAQVCLPVWDEKAEFTAEYIVNGRMQQCRYTPEEIAEKKVSLIQNAGSGINEAYDGYDIGSGDINGDKYAASYQINNACGASVMMRRDDFLRAGMFDARFFMYYEDTDLSYRMKKVKENPLDADKIIMYCPASVVRHIHTGSSKEWSPLFTYHVFRNKLLFIYKNISPIHYVKQFLVLYRQAKRENNFYKLCGCKDSLKIILKMKKNTSFRW